MLRGAVDVVGGELWHCTPWELQRDAYLVVGEGVCLRHDGGCVGAVWNAARVFQVVQSALAARVVGR